MVAHVLCTATLRFTSSLNCCGQGYYEPSFRNSDDRVFALYFMYC